MNFIKRAYLSLTRRLDKSLLLFLIVFILSNVMAGSIAISQASINVEKQMKLQLGANASLELDYDKIQNWTEEQWNSMESISPEMVEAIGSLDQVKYFDYNVETWLMGKGLQYYDPNMMESYENPYFGLRGINFAEVLDIANGDAELIEGRVFSQSEVDGGEPYALVSDQFAQLNNLHLGDLIVFTNTYYNQAGETLEQDVFLEIIGIFSPKIEQENSQQKDMWIDYSAFNRVYVPNDVVIEQIDWQSDMYYAEYPDEINRQSWIYITPVFVLKEAEMIDSFKVDALAFVPEYYKVRADSDAYDSVAGPIEFIGSLSEIILYVSIFATILILALVTILFLRDRKHELGIYLSLGEAKWKVITQIVIEVFVIAFVAISISLVTGTMIAKATSSQMINLGIGNTDTPEYFYPNYGDITQEDVINAYQVNFNLEYVLVMYGVSLSTVLLSTIGPMLYILRLKPKKILM